MASFEAAIAQADPDHPPAAKSLDNRHALARLASMLHSDTRRAFGKPGQYLVDQRKALFNLAHPDPDPRVDVALMKKLNLNAQTVVGGITKRPPGIEDWPGGAADKTACRILLCQCRLKHAGIDGAVLQGRGVVV